MGAGSCFYALVVTGSPCRHCGGIPLRLRRLYLDDRLLVLVSAILVRPLLGTWLHMCVGDRVLFSQDDRVDGVERQAYIQP